MRIRRSLEQITTGSIHGQLVVTGPYERRGGPNNDAWFPCRCSCSKELWVRFRSLTDKSSCGHGRIPLRHGDTSRAGKTRLYRIWQGSHQRCNNTNEPAYRNYGGRGITIAPAWDLYEDFRDWALANGYEDDLQLDRIDNDGPYSPENCRWVTLAQNRNNTRRSRWLEAFGECKTMRDWSNDERCVVSYKTLNGRVRLGWAIEQALTTPPGPSARRYDKGI